jgi:TolB-like protein/Flp pilus assembly protein TadD
MWRLAVAGADRLQEPVQSAIGLDSWTLVGDAVRVTDFRFGRFEIDSRTRELRKDGVRLRLQEQPFALLTLMLEHPGELLTREELRDRLWPDGTFVDFEHGLNAAIKRLRAVLGDNAERPRFVETLHRRGYRFIAKVERVNGYGAYDVPTTGDDRHRLAVLPFTMLGELSVPESFASGLTEELVTQLGRIGSDRLGVIARSSATRVQRADRTAHEIGLALRAHYLLEGTVRTEANRVRITAQLIEARGETQLWAESYDRPVSDSLLVQSDVATQIVRAVAVELLPDRAPAASTRTRNLDAYQAFLKGRFHWNRPGVEGVRECLAFYEQALTIDPQFAAAHASLARATVSAAEYYALPPRDALDAAEAAASRALALEPSESDAYTALAEVRRARDWNWDGADEAFRRALTINPSNEGARRLYGVFLACRGQTSQAATMTDIACELDPLCLVSNTGAAWVRYVTGSYEEVIDRCRHTIDMAAEFPAPHRLLAAALVQLGDPHGAIAHLESAPSIHWEPPTLACLAHALGVAGDLPRARSVLGHLNALSHTRYVSRYHSALAWTGVGDFDSAFASLSCACDERDPALMMLTTEPRFSPMRDDPRYGPLIDRLGFDREIAVHV